MLFSSESLGPPRLPVSQPHLLCKYLLWSGFLFFNTAVFKSGGIYTYSSVLFCIRAAVWSADAN